MTVATVVTGKLVSLSYCIRDTAGNLLDQTQYPVNYIHGGPTEPLNGIDHAVHGKQVGEEIEIRLNPHQGFGSYDPNLIFTDELQNIPQRFHFVGAEVPMRNADGDVRNFRVTQIADGKLTVDGNHPFAGKALRISISIYDVREPTQEELRIAMDSYEFAGGLH